MKEGLGFSFQTQPQFSSNPGQKNEVHAQVRNFFHSHLLMKCVQQLYLVIAQQLHELSVFW